MNKETIISIIRTNIMFIFLFVAVIGTAGYFMVSPIKAVFTNYKAEKTIIADIESKKQELEQILEDKKLKSEAAKNATVKDFYKSSGSEDMMNDFSPMFDNIISMIKQNGLRMKSIKYTPYTQSSTDDNLIKNGEGAYNGYKVDFELIGYYPQFTSFLSDFSTYPYFINLSKFEILPYQYDKRILIANVAITFYTKR